MIQVTNVAPSATRDQMKTLFNHIGKIEEIVLYPESELSSSSTRVCYVKFDDPEDVGVSLHLTNTVFIDRALIIVPVPDGRIPDEKTALEGSNNNLSLYPALPASTDLSKVDEIRRTIYVTNIDPVVTPEALMQYFGTNAGEVKYARMAGDMSLPVHSMFIEFTEQVSVMRALGLSGQVLGTRAVTIVPANTSITKSTSGSTTNSREIEEAMRKVNEAQPLIDAVLEGERRRSSRSRSRRSRSHRSRSRRSRSRSRRSRSHRRSRSRSHRSRRRSTSRSPRRPSPRYRRSRSKSFERRPPRRSPSFRGRRGRYDDDRGYSPPHLDDRDGRRPFRDRDDIGGRPRRSRSPSTRSSRKDRDRDSEAVDRRGRERGGSRRDSERKRDSDDRSSKREHKSSSKRHHEKDKKAKKESEEGDEEQEQYEEEGSEYEQQEETYEKSESDDNSRPAARTSQDMDMDSD